MRDRLTELLAEGIASGVFPGAQASVRGAGLTVDGQAGHTALRRFAECRPVGPTTRFDIASLTKALATSVLLMQAVDTGRLALSTSIARWFPQLPSANAITVAHLASHRAGFAAHRPFFETLAREGLAGTSRARPRLLGLIAAEPLDWAPGKATQYSDLGYLVLGWVIEAALDDPLDVLFCDRIAEPLQLEATGYGPVTGDVAATELDESGRPLCGVVHDENARAIGGVAGHAGLFSTARDVRRLVGHLADAHQGRPGIIASETVRRFWRPIPNSVYTLGWDTPTEPSSSGIHTTRGAAVGHLGFTGCSLWHDITRQMSIVLLTNRVHPSRTNDAIRSFRPRFHDAINEWLGA